ncbi:ankyrin repeat domain-containing protein [Turneriella parva]|uniref:Ankyrin n=1 Tax=Turneriella parva (strain ATCC BAA-1111 / DSM 21527 / NCTC 11395 / H) TaxID=869212 RepID=I4B7T7_TURPD|nr:ankyrin repeat domain-containing protein [Turneriella parva]AFM13344.1 Ankyrin [Turneriella parva DSM 21527]
MSKKTLQNYYRSAAAIVILSSPLFAGPQEDFLAAMRRSNLKAAQKAHASGQVDPNAADEKGKRALHFVCEAGNLAAFQWLVEVQADLAAKDGDGSTCLHGVMKARNPLPVLAAALERGLDKNAVNNKGQTPLMLAVQLGKKPVFEALLKAGADLNRNDAEGLSPLAKSVQLRRIDYLNSLIAAGANVNATPNAPLGLSYDTNQIKAFEALAKAGANLNATHEKSGLPLLIEMIRKERNVFAKFAIENGVNLNIADAEGNGPLIMVVKQTVPDLLPVLLSRGLSVESRDASGKTLLQITHQNIMARLTPARAKLFRALLDAGANPNTLSASGRPLLFDQSESGRYTQVNDLLEKGADFNVRDKTGNLVIHTTAQRNQLGTMKLVAAKFTDINITGDSGNTAAHFAARSGGTGILKLLKDRGANLELKNNAGDTPLSVAIGRQDPTTTRALIGLGVSLSDEGRNTPLMMEIAKSGAVNGKTVELLTVLKKAGANINTTNRYGNNALAYALNRKNFKMADAFLKAGAQSEAKDLQGNTLLHKLALSSRYSRIKNQELQEWLYLVLGYQHSDFQNNAGDTALHLAAVKDNNPDLEGAQQLFESLVNFGASVTVRNASGRTPYDLAQGVGWQTIAAANLPAASYAIGVEPMLTSLEPDRIIRLSTAGRDFFAAGAQGSTTRVFRLDDDLRVRAQQEFQNVQALAASGDGVVIAGVRPGEIDGAEDKKCKPGQNLVVYVMQLDSSLAPRWENTWGKPGSCQRSLVHAVTTDAQGNVFALVEFSGRRTLRRLSSAGALEAAEFARSDRFSEMQVMADGNIALMAQNQIFSAETGKTTGRLTKARSFRQLALAPSGTRYYAGDFTRLQFRRGISLAAEDSEGSPRWTRNFAGDENLSVERISASDGYVCIAGRTTGALHGQAHSTPGKNTDIYVMCSDSAGHRLFTRLFPAAAMQLVEMRVNSRGVSALAFQTNDKKNPDVVLRRIDKNGGVLQ